VSDVSECPSRRADLEDSALRSRQHLTERLASGRDALRENQGLNAIPIIGSWESIPDEPQTRAHVNGAYGRYTAARSTCE
jgi:hypothetical protein